MSYKITWKDQGVDIGFEGKVSIKEIDDAGQALYEDSRFIMCNYQLFNFERGDLSDITLEQIRNTAQIDAEASSKFPSPSLVVVSKQAIADALIFHYRQAAEGAQIKWEIHTFKTASEAHQWCSSLA